MPMYDLVSVTQKEIKLKTQQIVDLKEIELVLFHFFRPALTHSQFVSQYDGESRLEA